MDPVKLGLPDYYQIIKEPMDMTTIKKRLDGHQYKSAKDVLRDFDLMFNNCYTYNRPTEDVTIMAKKVQEFLHAKCKNMPAVEMVVEPKKKSAPKSSPTPIFPPSASDVPPMAPSPLTTGGASTAAADSGDNASGPSPASVASATPPTLSSNSASMPSLQAAPTAMGTGSKRPARTVTTKRKPDQAAPFDDAPLKKTKQGDGSTKQRKDIKICTAVFKELMQKRHQVYAWPFYQPVDVKGLNLHDYHEVIKKPMDLGTIKEKIDDGKYQTKEEFTDDVNLIFSNCFAVKILDSKINYL